MFRAVRRLCTLIAILVCVALALNGQALAYVGVSPASLSFPDTVIPAGSSSQFVTITNHLGQSLTFGAITASPNFGVSLNGCGTTLADGASCRIYVRFSPTAAGDLTGTLTINKTSPAGTETVALSGKGVSGGVPVSPASLSFPDTNVAAGSSSQVVNVTNYTGQALTFGSITASPNFAVSLNQCGTSLEPGAGCKIYVRFAPTVSGSLTGTLTINETAPAGSQTVNLSGNGIGRVPVSPATLSFPDTTIPAGSSSQVVSITNYTGQTLTFGSITASANFAVSLNQCGSPLAPGVSCKVYVRFAPIAAGTLTGALTINETDPAGVQTVSLSGKAIGQIPVSPASLSFADVTLPGVTSSQVVKLTNYSGQTLTFGDITASDNFTVSLNQCGTSLAAGAMCKIYVRFSPTASGDLTGALTINETDPVGTQTVTLSGKALSGGVPVSPGSLNFPNTATNAVSPSQVVLLKNYTGQPLTAPATTSGDFTVTLNTCTDPVAEGGNCRIYVHFNPASAGKKSGTLTINSSDGPQTVALGGLGFDTDKAPLLQLQVKNSPASVNLSLVDADHPAISDWIVWGADGSVSSTRKAGANLITDDGAFDVLPQNLSADTTGFTKYTWTGGTTVPSGNNVQAEIYTGTPNAYFQVRVPADTTARTLNIYTGVYGTARIEASIDDGSGLALSDVSVVSTQEVEKVYSIDYRAVVPPEAPATLTVKFIYPGDGSGGSCCRPQRFSPMFHACPSRARSMVRASSGQLTFRLPCRQFR
jgi:hypothetical protein